jgi:hypothetical protein
LFLKLVQKRAIPTSQVRLKISLLRLKASFSFPSPRLTQRPGPPELAAITAATAGKMTGALVSVVFSIAAPPASFDELTFAPRPQPIVSLIPAATPSAQLTMDMHNAPIVGRDLISFANQHAQRTGAVQQTHVTAGARGYRFGTRSERRDVHTFNGGMQSVALSWEVSLVVQSQATPAALQLAHSLVERRAPRSEPRRSDDMDITGGKAVAITAIVECRRFGLQARSM